MWVPGGLIIFGAFTTLFFLVDGAVRSRPDAGSAGGGRAGAPERSRQTRHALDTTVTASPHGLMSYRGSRPTLLYPRAYGGAISMARGSTGIRLRDLYCSCRAVSKYP